MLAAERELSVNDLVIEILNEKTSKSGANWHLEHERLLQDISPRHRLSPWNREEIYAERLSGTPTASNHQLSATVPRKMAADFRTEPS